MWLQYSTFCHNLVSYVAGVCMLDRCNWACKYIHVCMYVYICMYVRMFVYMYVCMYACMYMYVYSYTVCS